MVIHEGFMAERNISLSKVSGPVKGPMVCSRVFDWPEPFWGTSLWLEGFRFEEHRRDADAHWFARIMRVDVARYWVPTTGHSEVGTAGVL